MANENVTWIMKGLAWNDPYRIRTWQELVNWVNEVGFLPESKQQAGLSNRYISDMLIVMGISGCRRDGRRAVGTGVSGY